MKVVLDEPLEPSQPLPAPRALHLRLLDFSGVRMSLILLIEAQRCNPEMARGDYKVTLIISAGLRRLPIGRP